MALPTLTDAARMDRCLSAYGIIAFADHDSDGLSDPVVVDECIEYSIAEIIGKLVQRYEPAVLANVPVISEYATIIACRTLCTRRGNPVPEPLEMRYQEIIAVGGLLDQIASGKRLLIDADGNLVRPRGSFGPSFSNLTVDRGFNEKRIRVVDGASSMRTTLLPRNVDRERNLE